MKTLLVTYPASKYPEYDTVISKIVGRRSDGSGMGFGERDLSWNRMQPKNAQRKMARIANQCKGVKVQLVEEGS